MKSFICALHYISPVGQPFYFFKSKFLSPQDLYLKFRYGVGLNAKIREIKPLLANDKGSVRCTGGKNKP